MGQEMGGRFKREGTYVYVWLIHVEVRQKTPKFCTAIILQLKKKKTPTLQPSFAYQVPQNDRSIFKCV